MGFRHFLGFLLCVVYPTSPWERFTIFAFFGFRHFLEGFFRVGLPKIFTTQGFGKFLTGGGIFLPVLQIFYDSPLNPLLGLFSGYFTTGFLWMGFSIVRVIFAFFGFRHFLEGFFRRRFANLPTGCEIVAKWCDSI